MKKPKDSYVCSHCGRCFG